LVPTAGSLLALRRYIRYSRNTRLERIRFVDTNTSITTR
jgi:hypothetical protein